MVEADEETGEDEERIGQFHDGEAAQVAGVDQVRDNAQQ